MIQFLVRRFVKNHEDTENPDVRTAYGILSRRGGDFLQRAAVRGEDDYRNADALHGGYGGRL